MDITIREIEQKDYPKVLSLWNNEIVNYFLNADNFSLHYEIMKNDERYQIFVAVVEDNVS